MLAETYILYRQQFASQMSHFWCSSMLMAWKNRSGWSQVLWSWPIYKRPWKVFGSWLQPGLTLNHCSYLGSESVDEDSLSPSFFFSLSPSFSGSLTLNIKINKFFFKSTKNNRSNVHYWQNGFQWHTEHWILATGKYTLFSSVQGIFSRTDHMLCQKSISTSSTILKWY